MHRALAIAVLVVAPLTGCGSGAGAGESGAVTVFAAASLTAAYTEIGDAFHAAHPDVDVTFNFASSSHLVAQIGEGAPADVFASADEANMAKLVDAGGADGGAQAFATNSLQ